MKIGFVSTAFPANPRTDVYGGFRRMHMFIQALGEVGDLDVLFYVHPELDIDLPMIANTEERLAKYWNTALRLNLCNLAPARPAKGRWQEYIAPALSISDHPPYLQSAQVEQVNAVKRLLARRPDVVFVHRLTAMIPFLLSREHHPGIFFDLDDIEHVAYSRSIGHPPSWPGKRLCYLRLPLLKLWERRAIRSSKVTFVCSEHDRRYLSKAYGCANVEVIPNAIHIPAWQESADEPTLLFLGRMSYPPNSVAADYLIRRIWPIVYSALPNARLFIAGARPEQIASFADNPVGVEFLGFVDDLEELYRSVAVVCCPILSGGGTRIKILEAAAYGKPVVSTTIGAEGIDLRDGDEILLHDRPETFAGACIRLLRDRSLAITMGLAARASVAQLYDWNDVVKRIKMSLSSVGEGTQT